MSDTPNKPPDRQDTLIPAPFQEDTSSGQFSTITGSHTLPPQQPITKIGIDPAVSTGLSLPTGWLWKALICVIGFMTTIAIPWAINAEYRLRQSDEVVADMKDIHDKVLLLEVHLENIRIGVNDMKTALKDIQSEIGENRPTKRRSRLPADDK